MDESVVNTAILICRKVVVDISKLQCPDLWERMKNAVNKRPYGFFRITWIKGHLDKKRHFIDAGLFDVESMEQHKIVDEMASRQAVLHVGKTIGSRVEKGALARKKLCQLTQMMYLRIWSERLNDMNDEQKMEAELQAEVEAIRELEEAEELAFRGDDTEGGENSTAEKTYKLRELKLKVPNYAWQTLEMTHCTNLPLGAVTREKIGARTIEQAASFPFHYWSTFIKYVNVLMWANNDEDQRGGCSFAELAIDYELTTGQRIANKRSGDDTTWAEKASIMRLMCKMASKVYGKWNMPQMATINTFSMFGALSQPGFRRRPRFLGGDATKKVIASNLVGDNMPRLKDGRITLMGKVCYKGVNVKPFIFPKKHNEVLDLIKKYVPPILDGPRDT